MKVPALTHDLFSWLPVRAYRGAHLAAVGVIVEHVENRSVFAAWWLCEAEWTNGLNNLAITDTHRKPVRNLRWLKPKYRIWVCLLKNLVNASIKRLKG